MKNIAVIPARSGSKGLKDKNIKLLNGKPLLAYAIEAAQNTKLFDRIHVSTDSEEYAEIGIHYGADIPFLRDMATSSDTALMWDAMRFVLNKYEEYKEHFDTITVLQPTSPLRTSEDIACAFRFFRDKQANMISSVCEMEHSPLWSNTLPEDLSMKDFEDEKLAYLPRQSLPVYYRENGAVYILKVEHLYSASNVYKEKCYAYIMPKQHSIDIDDELDFAMAEILMKKIF
ncbi:MAG: acylneuraminate cytidylyltransferase family protein [Lachnospiraceae bacterium]|uniref:Acylneuraminate cytidylyltransferase family protein n=1 Tax=Petralouisia muris TaxID=3032872 RepID=A0AC61RU72_9FIRM|nr:acylneuraminate cytidylyltransferase family protein [Petralouisia muris]MCI9083281.1 acylneuraminate cytidylyltransferase family protein [Lachnospiraceae bacterium]TGY95119.1 acylneuraminate cytidylyltransferase family protein [Petralouisia muris]